MKAVLQEWHEKDNTFSQLIKFLIIGGAAASIYLITQTLIIYTIDNTGFAAATGFIISAIASYFLNTIMTFKEPLKGLIFVKFMIITTIGFILNMFIEYIVSSNGGHWLLTFFIVHITVPFFNFSGHKFWTFK